MVSDNKTLDKVYTAENTDELMDAYKDWACDYEADTVDACGYVAHLATAKALDAVAPGQDIRILDAGCGTGLVGQALRSLGYGTMDALDFSAEMLEQARGKGIYDGHMQADLGNRLDIPDNAYDAVVCCGTFTYGHVRASAFDELVRVTRPEGHVIFTIREGAYEDYGYRARMLDLERGRRWELVSMYDEDYLPAEGVGCKMCTYQVLG